MKVFSRCPQCVRNVNTLYWIERIIWVIVLVQVIITKIPFYCKLYHPLGFSLAPSTHLVPFGTPNLLTPVIVSLYFWKFPQYFYEKSPFLRVWRGPGPASSWWHLSSSTPPGGFLQIFPWYICENSLLFLEPDEVLDLRPAGGLSQALSSHGILIQPLSWYICENSSFSRLFPDISVKTTSFSWVWRGPGPASC